MKENNLEFPVFIKPNSTDGSFGITTKSICRSEQDIQEALNMVRNQFHIVGPVLMQEFLEGDGMFARSFLYNDVFL
jgi:D-alanine-D-alanine ligase